MDTESTPTLVIIGAPGAGKSRIGKRVAKLLGITFTDTDRRIVAAHGSIAQIFATEGEPRFRAIEREVVCETLGFAGVVSLGGGAILDPSTQADLAGCRVALLTVSADAVASRITSRQRPLLAASTPSSRVEEWQRLVDIRQPIYERLADKTWDTSGRPIDQIAQEIADWVENDRAGTKTT